MLVSYLNESLIEAWRGCLVCFVFATAVISLQDFTSGIINNCQKNSVIVFIY
ncbi:MAG: hypothetical protein LBC54_02325 [Bacteroidales bacterium OttesenSCG-928-I14]|nr:hypothetical protein [Bacteroidales bacterium OttesenSCG-928-I14]